jgi:predicted acylesterase/phospholipase RssA
MSKENYSNRSSDNTKPDKQRALVLQGGGALGAYEAGVISMLCRRFTEKNDKEKNKVNRRPLFDIVAGTSIGALNAAILVSNVVKNGKSWTEAAKELERFWTDGIALKEGEDRINYDIPPEENFSMYSWWEPWTDEGRKWGPNKKKLVSIASTEAARRYYSTKVFVSEAGKVFSLKEIRDDNKFYDSDLIAKRIILNEEPLKKKIEEFGKFPIGTCIDKGEPRLLVTAVDIVEGIPVTFDSYKKSDGKRKTLYYPRTKYGFKKHQESKNNNKNDSKPIIIEYEDGITLEHIMASGTLPELYDPKEICNRIFWDGGLLSNTPLQELLEAHRDYWINVEKKGYVPDLEVYIINVHPSRIDKYDKIKSNNYDFVKDRSNDILYGDRTYNEQLSAAIMNDFIAVINDLEKQALGHIEKQSDKESFKNDFKNLKNKKAENISINYGQDRSYDDLMKSVFRLTKVVRIERKYNPETSTSLKTGDLTSKTINELINEGEKDAKFI